MSQHDYKVHELVAKIERGEIRLPEMQRRYVWRKTRVRDLLDSLYRGYPSGTILTWETEDEIPTQDLAIPQDTNNQNRYQLLLDGQQRLTALSAILRGEPVRVRGRSTPIKILFNLEHPENLELVSEVDDESHGDTDADSEGAEDATENELLQRFEQMAFVVHNRRLESIPHWVDVTDVFKGNVREADILKKAGVDKLEDSRYDKYTERLKRLKDIKNYNYHVHVLDRKIPYKEVAEIFVRVNSLGTKLRSSDLALAQITAKWRDSLQIFQEFEKTCINRGFDLGLAIHLKNLVAFATNQSSFKTIGSVPQSKLKASWELAKEGMNYSLSFLRSNVKIESPALLASKFIAITIAKYGHKKRYALSSDEEKLLRYWVLLANTKGRYSRGSSETLLDQDLTILKKDGDVIKDLIDALNIQVGRLDIQPYDIKGKDRKSAYLKTMFLAFKADDARDWKDQLEISISHGGRHALQFHHIFPQSVLKKNGMEASKMNDICNLAFISGNANREIRDKSPAEYFPDIIKKSSEVALVKQCVPTDSRLWKIEAYEEFLEKRRELVAERLNGFLDHQ